jgi:tRNA(Ile2) C34 agmatinyltransferase TiaS
VTAVFVRLAPCPRCSSRTRLLFDSAGTATGGRCTDCGESLENPLATEEVREDELLLRGRASRWRARVPNYQDD